MTDAPATPTAADPSVVTAPTPPDQRGDDGPTPSREELVARVVRAGELLVSGQDPAQAASCFDTERFVFRGPAGTVTDYPGLSGYFASVREAFADRSIRRGVVVVEGSVLACQTWIEGTFVRPFTQSPVGVVEPNGARVVMDLLNVFTVDERGRLVEELVRSDERALLRQLGVPAV